MAGRLIRYLRRHHWGLLATFIALGGTAYASGTLPIVPRNSIGTAQLKANAVTLGKISRDARSVLRHPIGPAGGDLTGTYPNPTLKPPTIFKATYVVFRSPSGGAGWEDYGSPYTGVSYYRDAEGIVHLGGVAKSFAYSTAIPVTPNLCAPRTHQPIFVLPTEDRPSQWHDFAVDSGEVHGSVAINPSGVVICESGAGDQYVSLDGITFLAGG